MNKKKKEETLIVDAICPHCKKSFVKKGKIENYFWKDGKKLKVVTSIIPGDYKKKISNELDITFPLEKGELVEFFCQNCNKILNFEQNKNIFLMIVSTPHAKKMEVIRSAIYGEEFTAILDGKKKYWFGKTSEEKVKEMDSFIDKLQIHYAKGISFIP